MSACQISVVVPHYNSPELLIKLFESIPDTEDIEVIAVDDNSTVDLKSVYDYVGTRCNVQFFVNDSGVKNAGASRNVALKHVTGKWILFADSDDFFVDGWVENVTPFLDSDYDMVYFPPTSMDLKTGELSSRHVMYMEMILEAFENPTLKNITEMKFAFCSPWSKLIRTSIMKENNITFDEVAVSNDIMCLTKCAYYSKNVGLSDKTIYCVTRGGNSLTTNKDEKRFDTRVEVFVNRYIYVREQLSKKEFRYTHLDRQALGKLVDVFIEKWGPKKFFWISKLYIKNRIYIFDWGLLNPVTLFHKAKVELQWWMDIKKHRKNG